MKFVIDQELAQRLLNYLAGRPYGDVFQLIAQIQQLQPVKEPEKPA